MQYPLLDLLRPSLIPELCADIAAGPSGYIHFILVPVAAARTFPDQLAVSIVDNVDLSVKTALLAVIALCVQFCVHNIIIYVTHD